MEEAAQAEIVVEEKRQLYVEASHELKVMENLKERREKEHRKEMFAAETMELDDRKVGIGV
jgi:flagellar export protein FliJ